MQLLIAQKGSAEIIQAPDPLPDKHHLLIQPSFSTVSHGTEFAAVASQNDSFFSLFQRGLRSWEKIRDSFVKRGWQQTFEKVKSNLEKTIPLGYSVAGRVLQIGSLVDQFKVGDWVVAVGPNANHGTLVSVPRLMCASFSKPELVRDASCAALACVGIHAMHRAELSIGAEVAVMGLGVIGQFTCQALRASGFRVVAFDPNPSRQKDISSSGVETHNPSEFDFKNGQAIASHGEGLDAVFICAQTHSSEILQDAASLCRKRGKLIVVGEFPITLARECAYHKELELRFSAAYGEGRYDLAYEEFDQDYPIAQARWTIQRNLQLFLRWLEEGKISPSALHPKIIAFQEASSVYSEHSQTTSALTLIHYPEIISPCLQKKSFPRSTANSSAMPVAVVGIGRFAIETHLPNLCHASDKFHLHTVVGRSPAKTVAVGAKFKAQFSTCDLKQALENPLISAVFIITPHAEHTEQVIAALQAGKHIYVEKPLAITLDGLQLIKKAHHDSLSRPDKKPLLFVGFNRRFAPLSQKLFEERIKTRQPLNIHYLFRATPVPKEDWQSHPSQGGRFIGEVCHAIDWILWIVGSPLQKRTVVTGLDGETDIFLQFADSSRVHLHYQPVASALTPKEIVEIKQGSTRWVVEDFLKLITFENGFSSSSDSWKTKGHRQALDAFATALFEKDHDKEDPYGFIASSQLVLELAEEIKKL